MANTKQEKLPTNSRSVVAAVVSAAIIVLAGVLLILAGVNALPFDLKAWWLPIACGALWLSCVFNGVLRKQSWSIWGGFIFFTVALVTVLHILTKASYGALYPIYIAAPAIASLPTLLIARNKKLHLQSLILFGGLAVIFGIHVAASLNGFITAGIVVVMVGLFFFINIATSRRGRWDDGDRPQRRR